jgi:glutamate carboxypeptidase
MQAGCAIKESMLTNTERFMMNRILEIVSAYVDDHRQEMVDDLITFANLEGHFTEKENVKKAQNWFRTRLEEEGFICREREVAEDRCGILIADLGRDRPGKPIMFSGHCDTVHLTGSFDKPLPTFVEDGKIYGPGVLDMKGGLIIALYVVKALNFAGYSERPIRFIVVGEEESDHVGSIGDEVLKEESAGAGVCFNMETGQLNNTICTQKKSQFTYHLTVDGVGGHAGNDFLKGRNAINEAVYKIEEIIKLTDLSQGTTVTTATIQGGTQPCGIADHCEVIFDVRITNENEAERVKAAIYAIAEKTFIDGTSTKLEYYRAKLMPLQETEETERFFNLINRSAEEQGFPPFGKVHLGGASDAGNIQSAGVVVIDNLGIRGEYAHNRKEYGVLESLYDRTKIFAGTVLMLEEM